MVHAEKEPTMPTIIRSNGSKWAGEQPDDIPALLDVLASTPLDRSFEAYGNFYNPAPGFCDQLGRHTHPKEYEGLASFFGNFFCLSHVFNIYTNEPQVIADLLTAIDQNQHRTDYLAQPQPTDRRHPFNPDCNCSYCRYEAHAPACPICNPGKE
jgi:hypothetical protein